MTTAPMKITTHCGDSLEIMRAMPARSVNLTFTSSPYEAARTYGIGFKLKGQAFVDWLIEYVIEALRVTDGLVAFVLEGQTRQYRYSATPILLMADLHRRGVCLRKPPVYSRVGIPGSGGPDWLRNDYEFIVCATNGGKLPWSDNTACGHPPKWPTGGEMSNRSPDGMRVNGWHDQFAGGNGARGQGRKRNGQAAIKPRLMRVAAGRSHTGEQKPNHSKPFPVVANPGNIIRCNVGGGKLGHKLAHENEAPFPLKLAEFFIRSFCPPDGTVLDPFFGSGTTGHAAVLHDRKCIGIDVRPDQVALATRRIKDITNIPPAARSAQNTATKKGR